MGRFTFLAVFLSSLSITSCHQSWYWIDGPRSIQSVDSLARFGPSLYHSFTAIPYSELDSAAAQVFGRDENAMLFALVNELLGQGFQYVDDLDSADFIVTECIRRDFKWHEEVDSTKYIALPMKRVLPFSLNSSPFGSLDHEPLIPQYDRNARVSPKLTIVVYDSKTLKEIGQYQSGGIANAGNVLVASQHLIPASFFRAFYNPVPMTFPSGKGQAGLRPSIWTFDALNFWPTVTIYPNSPAASSHLKDYDLILEIDGRSTQNIDLIEFRRRMKGEVGHRLILTAWRWPGTVFLDTIVMGPRN
ncbi:MAG: hypothetical protein Q8922_10510 [Bacteroidota bacterium]|nr:hypothetical protein [Bacteroidota bacterium]MDP4234566.1 hypothetical protein [Bacteroidota bacterium]MDP4243695.1 hypothetical protein [Bacteroidota bacterium]MDP4288357.1 hypothetical protein [Bacteroidota bacterium]